MSFGVRASLARNTMTGSSSGMSPCSVVTLPYFRSNPMTGLLLVADDVHHMHDPRPDCCFLAGLPAEVRPARALRPVPFLRSVTGGPGEVVLPEGVTEPAADFGPDHLRDDGDDAAVELALVLGAGLPGAQVEGCPAFRRGPACFVVEADLMDQGAKIGSGGKDRDRTRRSSVPR